MYIDVTNQALEAEVTTARATAVKMSNGVSKLKHAKNVLDRQSIPSTGPTTSTSHTRSGITSYYIDMSANKLVMETLADSRAQAEDMALQADISTQDFEIRTIETLPSLLGTS